jgi:hypothetical protein
LAIQKTLDVPEATTPLGRFTSVFNAAYCRRVRPPVLNRSQRDHLDAMRKSYGSGFYCLPLVAWAWDQSKGHCDGRTVSQLLRNGEKSFAWASLLERVDTLNPASPQGRRVWDLAVQFKLDAELERLGFEKPVVQSA